MQKITTTVAINERGRRIGDSHPRAKLSDREVELILLLRAQAWTYERLRLKFGVSKSCVAQICRGEKRNHTAVAFKRVHLSKGK